MKTALLVVATGPAAFFDLTLPQLQKFARKIGADYIAKHSAPPAGVPATWAKLPLLAQHAPHYDRLILIDADILPHFRNITDEDLRPLLSAPVAMAPDHGMPRTSPRFSKWCEKHLGASVPEGLTYHNAGLISFDQATAFRMLHQFNLFGKTPDECFHEQDFLNFQLIRAGVPVHTLPQTMNWIAPQMRGETLQRARFIHFAGGHKHLIREYLDLLQ